MQNQTKFEIDTANLEVRITRLFKATPERLWQAYTEADQITKWWLNTEVDKLDVKVGGAWRFVDIGQDGKEHGFRGEFKEVDKPNKLVRTFEYEPFPGHIMLETVIFELQPDGQTKVVTTSKYENINDLNGMVSSGMEKGASKGVERLAKLVEEN
jgi:uncharacterized protein YndB with AHSA1/START domain